VRWPRSNRRAPSPGVGSATSANAIGCRTKRRGLGARRRAKHLLHDRPDEAFSFVREAVERLPRATIPFEKRLVFAHALTDILGVLLERIDEPLALVAMWTGARTHRHRPFT
jgi:hypothetical protein